MSIVRWSEDSEIYVYTDIGGYICCCWCLAQEDGRSVRLYTPEAVMMHMWAHRDLGHDVPAWAYDNALCQAVSYQGWL